MHASKRVQSIEPSPIRKIIDLSESRPDIVGLHAGEPDFTTPNHIVEAGVRCLRDGHTHYTHGAGILQLREAIANKLRQENGIVANPKTEITVTAGGFAAIFAITQATLDPGDEALIIQPSWPSYSGFVRLAGGVPVPVSLRGPDFEPSRRMLERHTTEKTRMIVINSPNNPTGSVYSKDCVSSLAEFAQEHGILVVSDEVYEKMVFDGNEHFSAASRPEFRDTVVTVNSFSKTYAMTGWRVGYVVANESITASIRKIHGYMISCAPSDAQRAALGALSGPQDCVNEMVEEYAARRERIVKGLNEIEGFRCVPPKGTFYAFPDISGLNTPSAEIANGLLEEAKVSSIPGSAFGTAGEGYLRFSFATSQRNIEEGIARVKAWRSERR